MNTCQSINHILKLAEADGNTILSISKSELMDKVIWMNNELSISLRRAILSEVKDVEYKKTKDKPHDPGVEYFVCNECKTLIAFPLKIEE